MADKPTDLADYAMKKNNNPWFGLGNLISSGQKKQANKPTLDRYHLRANSSEECWELLERDAISDDDVLIARFYDGNETGSPLANIIRHFLNKGEPEG